jgi:RNA polymerase sigma-70 factor (ECF subfamily)
MRTNAPPALEQIAAEDADAAFMELTDSSEFEAFYRQTARALRSYICRVASSADIADDILQESYIRLLGHPRIEPGGRKSYLYRTATNLIADYWREQSRQRRWPRAAQPLEAVPRNPDLRRDLGRLFARLGVRERALLWLAYVEGADHAEIGGILHVGEKSVRVLLFRARRKMEGILRKHGFHSEDRP